MWDWEVRNEKNSIGVSESKILRDATIHFKALGMWENKEPRREGQYRGILWHKKAVFRVEGLLTYIYMNNNRNLSSNIIF